MNAKEKMLKARELIQNKQYLDAREILYTVNHPTAQKWLTKLDEIDPPDLPDDPFAPIPEVDNTITPSTTTPLRKPQSETEYIDPNISNNYLKQKNKKGSKVPMPIAIGILSIFIALCLCATFGGWRAYQAFNSIASEFDSTVPIFDPTSGFGGSIGYGETVNGQISNALPLQDWRFNAEEGDMVVITMRSSDFDSLVELYDSEGYFLNEDDDSGGDLDAQIQYTIPQGGEYIITATEWWSDVGIIGGEYSLTLERR
ncbi:MAG: hypothetical protein DWQ04_34780 [Chloroflexi bacterium]|nr:MAG: hypothetical protein DWQ04_34780 [Chloroflexota bacterium]